MRAVRGCGAASTPRVPHWGFAMSCDAVLASLVALNVDNRERVG